MTHDELVARAIRWLKNSASYPTARAVCRMNEEDGELTWHEEPETIVQRRTKCSVVLSEIVSSTSETPDAIGFCHSGDVSILIECKASLSDYYSDGQKMFRRVAKQGVGDYRYYLTPKGLLKPDTIRREGWGYLEIRGSRVMVQTQPDRMEKNMKAEMNMMWSTVRRLQTGNEHYCKPIK